MNGNEDVLASWHEKEALCVGASIQKPEPYDARLNSRIDCFIKYPRIIISSRLAPLCFA